MPATWDSIFFIENLQERFYTILIFFAAFEEYYVGSTEGQLLDYH